MLPRRLAPATSCACGSTRRTGSISSGPRSGRPPRGSSRDARAAPRREGRLGDRHPVRGGPLAHRSGHGGHAGGAAAGLRRRALPPGLGLRLRHRPARGARDPGGWRRENERLRVFGDIAALRAHLKAPVATVGNFDGLHRGHRAIVDRVLERAHATGASSLLITFDPHPLKVLAPERVPPMITTRRQKLALFEEAGLEFILILPFTVELAGVTPERFVREHLSE